LQEDRAVFEAALSAQRDGLPAALATVIETEGSVPRQPGSKMLVWPNGRIVGTVGGGHMESLVIHAALGALTNGQTQIVRYNLAELGGDTQSGQTRLGDGTITVFIEPLNPPPTLVVVGCGHVGKAVAELAHWMGFRVIAADDRPGYATPEHIPGIEGYIEAPPDSLADQLAEHTAITAQTYIVALTRSSALDEQFLPALLKTDTPYIGLIGSRKRWLWTMQALTERGISTGDLARIHSPVGLDLKAETPKEIALSILAEIVMVQRGGTGRSMTMEGQS
jgi:xanthine dehydrogenase accessory factor